MLGLKVHARLLGIGFNVPNGDLKNATDHFFGAGVLASRCSVGLEEGRKGLVPWRVVWVLTCLKYRNSAEAFWKDFRWNRRRTFAVL